MQHLFPLVFILLLSLPAKSQTTSTVSFGSRTDGQTISTHQIAQAKRLDVSGNTLTIKGYRLYVHLGNRIVECWVKGDTLSADARTVLDALRPGNRFGFLNIKAEAPSGVLHQLEGIWLTVK